MRTLPVLVGLLLFAASAGAQEVHNPTVSGTLVSRSATIPIGETAAELFTVPSGKTFIMTQACASSPYSLSERLPPLGGYTAVVILVGSRLGVVPQISCGPFQPGIAFGEGERISCELTAETSVAVSCLVTGVLQRIKPGNGRGPR